MTDKKVKCCKCSKVIIIDENGFIIDAGEINISFGYASTLDGNEYRGYLCDDCLKTLKHLKCKTYL